MSYPTTLGFAPLVECTNVWTSKRGKKTFLDLVHEGVSKEIGEDVPLRYTKDLDDILLDTRIPPSSTLDDPPEEVLQAVRYAVVMLVGRIRMNWRLDDMRQQCSSALPPRGCKEVEFRNEQLFGKAIQNSGNYYNRYLADQRRLRTSV